MRRRPHQLAVCLFTFLVLRGSGACAQVVPATGLPDSARLATARQMLDAAGTVDLMVASMRAALPGQRAAHPEVPAQFWGRVESRLIESAPELVDSIAVVYATRFSLDDLAAFLAFYRSPAAMRLREIQPEILEQSTSLGQRWGMRIGAEVGASMVAE